MKILSIETSCDDTGISILEAEGGAKSPSFKVLANNASSQIQLHIPYGGVYPALAKREHIKNLPILLEKTLKEAKLNKKEKPVDLIAVTAGPGLEITLWTGIVFAKDLAKKWKVPLIPVNHMEGHVLSVFGKDKGKFLLPKIKTPALSLLVSGGHTELVLVKKWINYEIIGETLDDAAGEAFDKVARMLGLPYPGGPEISRLAETQRKRETLLLRRLESATARARGIFQQKNIRASERQGFSLPRPMLHSKNFDFSFSGLKTAVLYLIRDLGGKEKISKEIKAQIALEFENAAIECLAHKTKNAMEKYKIKTLIVAGGVAANQHLRNEMKKLTGKKVKLFFPTKELSTDNSLMIAIVGYLNYLKNKKKVPQPGSINASGNLRL